MSSHLDRAGGDETALSRHYIKQHQKMHHERLRNIKPHVDMKAPKFHKHFINNKKKRQQMSAAERNLRVEQDNLLLVERMRNIVNRKQVDNSQRFNLRSLNRDNRRKEMMRIVMENELMLKRIITRPSYYSVKDWEKDHKDKIKRMKTMCRYPYVDPTKAPKKPSMPQVGSLFSNVPEAVKPAPPKLPRKSHTPRGRLRSGSSSSSGPRRKSQLSRTMPNTSRVYRADHWGAESPRHTPRTRQPRRPAGRPASSNHATRCLMDGEINVSGHLTHLRVFERPGPWRLDLQAFEPSHGMEYLLSLPFVQLKQCFGANPELFKASNRRQLVAQLLTFLVFVHNEHDGSMELCVDLAPVGDAEGALDHPVLHQLRADDPVAPHPHMREPGDLESERKEEEENKSQDDPNSKLDGLPDQVGAMRLSARDRDQEQSNEGADADADLAGMNDEELVQEVGRLLKEEAQVAREAEAAAKKSSSLDPAELIV